MKKIAVSLFVLAFLAPFVASCDNEDYETGDSTLSYLKAEFGLLHTQGEQQVDYMLTDDGETVTFSEPVSVSWAVQPDTLYRGLTYYDISKLTVFSTTQVPVVQPALRDTLQQIDTDPLTVEALWKGGGYLNVRYAVKSGVDEEIDSRQSIGLIRDSLTSDSDGNRTLYLTMRHAQNGVPEYYSVRGYLSMALPDSLEDVTIQFSAYTYDGWQTLTR